MTLKCLNSHEKQCLKILTLCDYLSNFTKLSFLLTADIKKHSKKLSEILKNYQNNIHCGSTFDEYENLYPISLHQIIYTTSFSLKRFEFKDQFFLVIMEISFDIYLCHRLYKNTVWYYLQSLFSLLRYFESSETKIMI